jgi:hypothetical protein
MSGSSRFSLYGGLGVVSHERELVLFTVWWELYGGIGAVCYELITYVSYLQK